MCQGAESLFIDEDIILPEARLPTAFEKVWANGIGRVRNLLNIIQSSMHPSSVQMLEKAISRGRQCLDLLATLRVELYRLPLRSRKNLVNLFVKDLPNAVRQCSRAMSLVLPLMDLSQKMSAGGVSREYNKMTRRAVTDT